MDSPSLTVDTILQMLDRDKLLQFMIGLLQYVTYKMEVQ